MNFLTVASIMLFWPAVKLLSHFVSQAYLEGLVLLLDARALGEHAVVLVAHVGVESRIAEVGLLERIVLWSSRRRSSSRRTTSAASST